MHQSAKDYISNNRPGDRIWKDQGSVTEQDLRVLLLTEFSINKRLLGETVIMGSIPKKRVYWKAQAMSMKGKKVNLSKNLDTVQSLFKKKLIRSFRNLSTFHKRITRSATLLRKVANFATRCKRIRYVNKIDASQYLFTREWSVSNQLMQQRALLGISPPSSNTSTAAVGSG